MARGLEGTIIARRYELLSLLGRGSYASVWRARQLDAGGEVAVKVLAPGYADDPALIEDFLTQARSYLPFRDNPRIAAILDGGHDLDTGFTYVAMTLLGETVEGIVRETGPLPPERVFHLAEDTGSALRAIHRAGLVHRDVKATNIMTAPCDDRFVLTDFAVGLLEDLADQTAPTVDMTRVGNWAYASPERIHATRKSEIGPSSDLYSLGVVLFRAATAQFPFNAPFPQIISEQLKKEPPDPRALRPEIPRGLAELILRCLRKAPEERFRSADEFLEAVRQARTARGRTLPLVLKSRPVVLSAAGVAALAILALAATALLPSGVEVEIRSQPPGASFRLYAGEASARSDAKASGVTPKTVKRLDERTYTVVVEKDGYFPKEATFEPFEGRPILDTIVLEKRVQLRVTSDPPGAVAELHPLGVKERVDGRKTPADFGDLRAGPHELTLRLENFVTLVDTILVGREGGVITRRLVPGSLVTREVPAEPAGATTDAVERSSERRLGPGERNVAARPDPPTDTKALARESPRIRETLHLYEHSLEARDIRSFARLWVALPPKELEDFEAGLQEIRSQEIEITEDKIQLEGNQATVRFRETRSIELVTGKSTSSDRTRTMTMRRVGSDWLIRTVR